MAQVKFEKIIPEKRVIIVGEKKPYKNHRTMAVGLPAPLVKAMNMERVYVIAIDARRKDVIDEIIKFLEGGESNRGEITKDERSNTKTTQGGDTEKCNTESERGDPQ